jgi:hypothetical protein
VLYGHHFAAWLEPAHWWGRVDGADGYLPGTLWILAGVVFAGAVQDMTVRFLSTRRYGRSLGDMIRSEMGPVAGSISGVGVLLSNGASRQAGDDVPGILPRASESAFRDRKGALHGLLLKLGAGPRLGGVGCGPVCAP